MIPNSTNRRNRHLWRWLFALLLITTNLAVVSAQQDPPHTLFLPLISNQTTANATNPQVIPDQYIVVLKETAVAGDDVRTASAAAMAVVSEQGGEVLYTYENTIYGFAAKMPAAALTTLQQDPNIDFIEPDQVISAYGSQTPATWGLDRVDQRDLPLNNTYNFNTSGVGVHAYIIDTGVRSSHREFTGRIGNGFTSINDGQGTDDCNGHGTHVAGTVGGSTFGIAKAVTIHPVRVLDCNGSGANSQVIAGVDWVTANRIRPAVANMSLGGSVSTALDTAVRRSIAAGVTYALAAGNSNGDACTGSPSRVAEALTVGASTQTDARSSFSDFGTCVDLFAPGSAIVSASNGSDTSTATLSGTSMASPHVAGVAALFLESAPNAAPEQVAAALVGNATPNKLTNVGSGSPNRLLYALFIAIGPTPPATTTPGTTPTPEATPTPGVTTTPGTTPTPGPSPTATATPLPGACTDLVANGGFETGATAWTESSRFGFKLICDKNCYNANLTPHSGNFLTWLGGANKEVAEIRQLVKVPAGQKATLRYWYSTQSSDNCGFDFGSVQVEAGGQRQVLRRFNLCKTEATNGWVQDQIDLSQYAGQDITLVFRDFNDNWKRSSFFIDDIALLSGASCPVGQTVTPTAFSVEAEENALQSANARPEEGVEDPATPAK